MITLPLLFMVYDDEVWTSEAFILGPAHVVIAYVLPAAIVIAPWIRLAATPGKMAISSVIVDARTGGAPSSGQYVIRYLGYFVSTIPLLLGLVWVGFDARKQGWHDKVAGTVVIRRKGGATAPVQFEKSGAV